MAFNLQYNVLQLVQLGSLDPGEVMNVETMTTYKIGHENSN